MPGVRPLPAGRRYVGGLTLPASEELGQVLPGQGKTNIHFRSKKMAAHTRSLQCARMAAQQTNRRSAHVEAQKGNKEKKKPKADKNQSKSNLSAYKVAQGQGKPSTNPFARKT